ncbi:MAG TPA: response regulator, partial [Acidimicrobiales bacterium]|nr:response regulator [Acidimicrobiales bacterium]
TGAGIRGRLTKPVRPAELHAALVDASTPMKSSSPTAAAAGAPPVPAIRGTVLVAEDNDLNQMVARGILSSLGFACDVVANGLEAVEAVRQKPYMAVLMDFHMPEMDGVDATIEIRRQEGDNRRTPIIAMTAGARIEDRDRCLGAGMDDYISKPVAPKDLEAALAPWVNQEPPTSTVAADPEAAKTSGVVDPERLTALLTLEAEQAGFVAGLLNSFFERLPVQLEDLDAAVTAGDGLKVKELAHQLKGTAASLAATAISSVCGELEAQGRAGDVGPGAALVAQLHVEADRAREAFQMLLAGGEPQKSRPTRSEPAL